MNRKLVQRRGRDYSDLVSSLAPEFKSLDYFHDLPPWAILKDTRNGSPDRAKRDDYVVSLVDKYCAEIQSEGLDTKGRINEELKGWMCKILLMADRQRDRFETSPYSNDSIITLIYEIWWTDHLHRDHARESGHNYARTHLFQSVINAIRDEGVSDLYTLVAILKHDDLEDYLKMGFKEPKPDKLLCTQYYIDKLSGEEMESAVSKQIAEFRKAILQTVTAVTLYNKGASITEKHEGNFQRALDSLRRFGFRPTRVRLAEREHNIDTLAGKSKENGDLYAQKTLDVYPRFAAFLGLDRVEEKILRGCYKQLDPDVLTGFEIKRQNRLNRRFGLDKSASKLLHTLRKLSRYKHVEFLAVKPNDISRYIQGSEGMLGIDDIPEDDPMFEVVILVDDKSEIGIAKDNLMRIMKTSEDFSHIKKLKYDKNADPQIGMTLKIENPDPDPELGGYLFVRINTVKDEVRCDQGKENVDLLAVEEVLERTKTSASGIYKMLGEICGGEISIQTPRREVKRLSIGATGLDFAAAIHGKLLREMRGIRVQDPETLHYLPANPLDERSHGEKVQIITEKDEYYDPELDIYKVGYASFPFASSHAKKSLRSYFRGLKEEERMKLFAEYLSTLCGILGIERKHLSKDAFFQVLLLSVENLKERSENEALIRRLQQNPKHIKRLKKQKEELKKQGKEMDPTILKNVEKRAKNDEALYSMKHEKLIQALMNGSLDPLKVFADLAEEDNFKTIKNGDTHTMEKIDSRAPMIVHFDVPHTPGIGGKLLTELGEIGVNVEVLIQSKTGKKPGRAVLQLSLDIVDAKNTSFYDLLLALLKISFRYPVETSSSCYEEIFDSKISRIHQRNEKNGVKPSEPQPS